MFYVQGYSKLMALEYKDPKAEFGFVPWRDKIYSSNVKTCKKNTINYVGKHLHNCWDLCLQNRKKRCHIKLE